MKIDLVDFLEHFDSEEIIDKEAGIYRYKIKKHVITLQIFMIVSEETVCFTLSSEHGLTLVEFCFSSIAHIICDKNKPDQIKLLFYKENKEKPVVTANIKPHISLQLNTE